MSLGPYNPFRHVEALRRELDRVFPDGFNSLFNKSDAGIGFPVDLHETEEEIVAICNLPGIENQEDIHINVDNNMLSISGVVQKAKDMKDEQVHRQERYFGRFQRTVSLPAPVVGEGVKATYKNGLLEIHIPKQQEEPKKRIHVDFH